MDYMDNYKLWTTSSYFDEPCKNELLSIKDKEEIEDRFYKELEFGTGGLRGIMGAGSNRMNKYNIRRASNGFAKFLIDKWGNEVERGVAIAYDTRNNSKDFALEAALAFAACGVPVHLFSYVSATPLLSFAVRQLSCVGGVVITASHNPKEYNGYKAYDENGCQVLDEDAKRIIAYVNAINIKDAITTTKEKAHQVGLLNYIGEDMLYQYSRAVRMSTPANNAEDNAKISVAYSAIHGSGAITVKRVLQDAGFTNIQYVEDQDKADGNFPTVASPNPGNEASMKMVIDLGDSIGADIAVASDPDADRTGVAIKDGDKLRFLDGNSIGALILYYLCERHKGNMPSNPCFVTTIVSGQLASDIAKDNGIEILKTLTGFKYIGEYQTKFIKDGMHSYFFGCEESFGFLGGDYVRDKCASYAILTLCSACAYYKKLGKTLGMVMEEIHKKYGYYLDALDNYRFEGISGSIKMNQLIEKLRALGTNLMPGIESMKDYKDGIDGLPKSNVLKYFYSDGSWMSVRPSGTEPLLKLYWSVKASSLEESEKLYNMRKKIIDELI